MSESAIQHVLNQGGGSARDTLSALELVASSGGDVDEGVSADEFVEALIDQNAGTALAAVAKAAQLGADARTLSEDIIRHLRNCFLAQMSPELVHLSDERRERVADQGRRLGVVATVRAIETLGEMLIEMRHAPDARLLLEVALVTLTRQQKGDDVSGLVARIERLEAGVVKEPTSPVVRPAPVNPATGRAQLGGKAAPKAAPRPAAKAPAEPLSDSQVVAAWGEVVAGLKPLVRALYSAISPLECAGDTLTLAAPNEMHQKKADEHRATVEAVLNTVAGRAIGIAFVLAAPKDPTSPTARTQRPVVEELDDVVDPRDIVDSSPVSTPSALDQLTKAFPGSQVVDQPKKG